MNIQLFNFDSKNITSCITILFWTSLINAEECLKAMYWGKTHLALDIGIGAHEYLQAMDYGGHSCKAIPGNSEMYN